MVRSSRRSTWHVVLHLLGYCLICLSGWQTISQTRAEGIADDVPGTWLHTNQDIYAYVGTGERLQWNISKATNGVDAAYSVTIYSPTGQISTCTMAAGAAINTPCSSSITASATGIYTIRIVRTPIAGNTGTFTAKVNWQVNVRQANNTNIPGRVYVKKLTTYDGGNTHDFDLQFVSEYGYRYLAAYKGFRGIYANISADAYGVRLPNSCLSAYRSMEGSDPGFTPPNDDCGGLYKIFFNTPNGVPASANRWNYTTGQQVIDWINPTIQTPSISGLTFSSSSLTNRAGNFSFMVVNFSGNALFQIDANHNGSYTDAVDRTIPFNALSGSNTIAWDGRDGTGALISCVQAVQARVLIDREAEIHFTMWDVEGLGSLAVTRQNGAGAPDSNLYWDDSYLTTTGRCPDAIPTNPLSATAGANSSSGVHGWNYPTTCTSNGTWGDERYIDNWAYATSSAQTIIEVPGVQPSSLTASVTNLSICSGEEVAINYTTTPSGETVRWDRMPGNRIGIGNVQDFPTATGTAPESYTYTAYIPSVSGCESNTVTTIVTVNPRPVITPSVCSLTICSGQTGNITFISSIPGSTIHWERTPTTPAPASGTGDISQSFINTGPTSLTYTYKIWATSPAPASCPSSTTITCEIVVTPGLEVTAVANSATVCVGSPLSLSASVVPIGNYTYAWTGPNGYAGSGATPTVSASAGVTQSGSYTVVVTDAAGCSGTAVVPVVVANCCINFALNQVTSNAHCGQSDGGATITASGGTAPYTYAWSQGASTSVVSGLAPGSYSVVVTDAIGCSTTALVTIGNVAGPQLAVISTTPATCVGATGVASVTASGGTTPYSYTWSTGATGSVLNGVVAGTYSVTVADATGCRDVLAVDIDSTPGNLTSSIASTPSACGQATGIASVTASGGATPFTYRWSNGATTAGISGLVAGAYSVTVTDGNGCFVTNQVTISDLAGPSVVVSNTAVSCNSTSTGLALAVASGGTAPYTYLWSNGATSSSVSGLAAGAYSVIVRDANGCQASGWVKISEPAVIVAELSASTIVCGNTTGEITVVSIEGGTAPYSYQWSNGSVSQNLVGVVAGLYSLTVADANGCLAIGSATLVLPTNCCSLTATAGNAIVACEGGTFNLAVTAGNSTTASVATPLTYVWRGPNGFADNTANPTITPATAAAAGIYSVTVTDGAGCAATASVSVTVSSAPSAGNDVILSICNNETVDLATYFTSGGSFSALNGSLTGSVFNGITSGVGSFTVLYSVGGNGCPIDVAMTTIIVRDCSVPPCNYPISSAVVDATCGNSDGRATFSLGGLPTTGTTVGYAWSNGKTGPSVTGLAAGVYSVTATISTPVGTCTVVEQIQVNEIGGPVAEIDLISAADCMGANGAVAIEITSGTGPFRISWNGAATGTQTGVNLGTTTIPNLAAGQYTFEITSATSNTACSSFLSVTIPRDNSDRITLTATPTNATVCGSATGSIQITATPAVGVTGPFSFSLNGVEIATSSLPTYMINGLLAGTYTVGVSSAEGCSAADVPVVIQDTGVPAIAGWTAVDPNCPSDQGKLVFAGGQPTATFRIREAASGSVVANNVSGATSTTLVLPAGTYTIEQTVTGSNCESFTSVTINRPEGLDFNVQYTKVTCGPGGVANNDGSISIIQISGGTPPYTIAVRNAQNQVVSNLQAVAPGIYAIQVVDSKGCSGVENVFVTVPDCQLECPVVPMNTFVVDANCTATDGRAVAQLGAYDESEVDYQWSNGFFGKNVNGLASGVYSVTATILTGSFVGCAYVEKVNVNQISGPVVAPGIINPSSCAANTGTVSFSITSGTGPFTVTWSGAMSSSRSVNGTTPFQFTQTGLAPGDYVFTFKGSDSDCQTVLDVTIPVSSSSSITLTATPNPASGCGAQDGSINLTASGSGPAYIFSLNGVAYTSVSVNTVVIPNLPAGVYTVGVTSGANGCETERQVIIQETGAPVVSGWSSQSALCATNNGTLTYAGGSGAGTYRVLLGGTQVATTPENATGPVVYTLPQGIYTVELTNGTCTSFQNFTITGPEGIDFNVQYVAETCGPGGVGNGNGILNVIQINGGTAPYTVLVINNKGQSFAGPNLTNLLAGNYYVSVVDANGCPGNEDALVTVPPCALKCPPLAFNTSVVDTKCGEASGSAIAELLNMPSGATPTYQWSNGQNGPTISGLTSGVYSVTATLFADNTIYAGCMYVDTITVNDISGPIASVSATAGASCTTANGSVALNIQGGTAPYTISWTGAASGSQNAANAGLLNIAGLPAGSYVFTVTGSNSTCKSLIDVVIPTRTPNGFTLAVNPTAASGCGASDGRLTISVSGGTGPFTYSVNGYVQGVSATRTFSVQSLPAGVYAVEVMDANGCVVNRENVLINPAGPSTIAGWTAANALCPAENGTIQFAGTGVASDEYVVTIAGTATEIGHTAGNVAASYSVPGGTYLISKTTSTSCVSVTTVTVTQPDGLDFNIQYQNPSCAAPASGSLAVVQPVGGTAPYTYTVTGATGVVTDLTALTSGSYTVTLGDSRGCTFANVVTLTGGANLTLTASTTPTVVCIGQPINLSAVALGGTAPLTYSWTGSDGFVQTGQAVTATATTSGIHTYTVVATDANNCTTVQSTTVTVGSAPVATATPATICVGETVTLEATAGGTSYSWSGPNFSTVTSLPTAIITNAQLSNAGVYSVVITGGNGCTGVASTTVTINQLPSVTALVSSGSVCVGGSFVLNASATPAGSYTFTWGGPNNFTATGASVTITNALATASGSYTVVATSATGCSSSAVMTDPITVTVCCQGFGLNVVATNAHCGQSDGGATVTASGGTAPYSYAWSDGATNAVLTGVAPGSYSVIVTDAVGCSTTALAIIGNVEGPQLAVVSTTPATCLGATGAASVVATGGTAPYTYLWDTGASGAAVGGLVAGVYSVTVMDATGCFDVISVEVESTPGDLTTVASSTASACGQAIGVASVTASGGTAPYSYLWNTGATTASVSGLVAGVYNVVITDANQCSVSATVTINDLAGPTLVASGTAVSCTGSSTGTALAVVSGGTAPYSYLWSTGATSASVSGLLAGVYSVVVTDANGCKVSGAVSVTQPAALVGELSASTLACGSTTGTITLVSLQGGRAPYTYLWSNGATSASLQGVAAGVYSLTITDANGCVAVGSATLVLPTDCCESRDISLVGVNPQCGQANGRLTATLSGTLAGGSVVTSTWRNVATNAVVATNGWSVSGLAAGSYSVSVTVTSGSAVCSYSAVTSLSEVDGAEVNVLSTTPSACAASTGVASLSVTGAGSLTVSYAGAGTGNVVVSSGVVSLSGLSAGLYSVTVQDANGCTSVTDFVIESAGAVSLNPVAVATASSCTGSTGSVTVSWGAVAGVSSYSVSVGGQSAVVTGTSATFAGLSGGSYPVTVSIANNASCGSSTTAVTVPVTGGPALAVMTIQPVCAGSSGVINVVNPQAGVVYDLYALGSGLVSSGTSFTVGEGPYEVRASVSGCSSSTVVSLMAPEGIDFNVSVRNGSCGTAGSLTVVNQRGGTGVLTTVVTGASGVVSNLNSLAAGSYTVVVSDANGCSASQVVSVTGSVAPPSVNVVTTNAHCGQPDGSIIITASGGTAPYQYMWNTGAVSSSLSALLPGSYTVTVTDAAGCSTTQTVAIGNVDGPQVTVLSITPATCVGTNGAASVTATGGTTPLSYVWSTGATGSTLSGVTAGAYSVTVTDGAGCSDVILVTIPSVPGSLTSTISSTASACGQAIGTATVTATGGAVPLSYRWNTGATTSSISGLVAGVYSVTVTDGNGCMVTNSVTVNDLSGPSVTASFTAVMCNGSATGVALAVASGGTAPYSYLWSTGATSASVSGLLAGVYSVVVTDANGCKVSGAVSVTQPAALVGELSASTLACGSTTGTITLVSLQGGRAPYTYLWSNGATSASLQGVAAGVYSLTITDANGCVAVGSATLVLPTDCIPCEKPVLTVMGPVCDTATNTYSIHYIASIGAIVTANVGTINTVTQMITGIPAGQNLIVTATSSCSGITSSTVVAPNCTVPVGCTLTAGLSVGQAVCLDGTTYLVSVTANSGATLSVSGGTINGNVITGTVGTSVTVVANVAGCDSQTAIIASPVSCTTACVNPLVSIAGTVCGVNSYSVKYTAPAGVTVTSSVGLVKAGTQTITNIPLNTPVSLTVANGSCPAQIIDIAAPTNCPPCMAPVLTVSGPVCNTVTGTSYSVTYTVSMGASVTASSGTINTATQTISGLAAGTNIVITATSACGAVTSTTVLAPQTCTPPVGCTALAELSVGQAVCVNGASYIASVTATNGAVLTVFGGTVLNGVVSGVVGTNVTVVATMAGCNSVSAVVASPESCTATCTIPLVSIAGTSCNGTTYSVKYTAPVGVTVIATSGVGVLNTVTQTIAGIPLGTPVSITVSNGTCEAQVIEIAAPTNCPGCSLAATIAANTPVVCVGSPLSLSVTVSPAGSYTYVWSGPNFSTTTTLPTAGIASSALVNSGIYTVLITNADGCTATASTSTSVTVAPLPPAVSNILLSICNNEFVDLSTRFPAGGTFAELTSSNALTGSIFNGIVSQAGTFRVLYTSAVTGCGSATAVATIVVRSCSPPPCNFPISTAVVDANCGANDGRAQALVGGLPAGSSVGYNWSNGASGPQITGLVAGVYSVTATVTNVPGSTYLNGCIVVDTVNVNDMGGPVVVQAGVIGASCPANNNGQVTLNVQTGTAPFVISYTGPVSGSLTAANLGNQTVTGLPAGNYVFRITSTVNGESCSGYLPVHIPRDDSGRISVTATPTNTTTCGSPTGRIQYTVTLQPGVTAPFTYLLNGQVVGTSSLPTFTLNNVVAGSYVVSVVSADGCTAAEVPVLIEDAGAPAVTGWTATDATCPNDVATLVYAGGQPATTQYRVTSVETGGTVATVGGNQARTLVLSAGSYAIIRTSTVDNCTSVDTLIINGPTGLDFNVQYTAATCSPDGSAQADGKIRVVQIEGGEAPYTVRILDSNNAVVSNANVLAAGNYVVEVRDANGCAGIQQLLITIPDCQKICPALPLNTVVVDANCGTSDGTATASLGGLSAGSFVNYTWSNGQNGPTAFGLSSGVYNVTATVSASPEGSSVGCQYVGTVNVNEIGGPIPAVLAITPSRCSVNTGMVSLSIAAGTAPYTVSWTGPVSGTQAAPNPSSVLISNLAPGSYTFVVTGAGSGCKGVMNVTVPVSTSADMTVTVTPTNVGSCDASNGQLAITVSGGTPNYNFTLNGTPYSTQASGLLTIPNLPAGYYTIGVTAANGCTTSIPTTIATTGGPAVAGWTAQNALCPDNTGTLTFAGGQAATVSYRVLLGGTTLIATVPGNTATTLAVSRGTYVIERRDNTCISSYQSFTINSPDGIDFNVQYIGETCAPGGASNHDGKIQVVQISGGTQPYTVTVLNSQNQIVSNLNALAAGAYTVRVTDANSCTGISSVLITVPPCPQLCPNLSFDKTVLDTQCGTAGGTATATLLGTPAGSFVTYLWSNGQNGSTITGLASGTYSVTATVTTQNGVYNACQYVDVIHVSEIGGPVVNLNMTTGASCTASNGSAVLTIAGGMAPYTVAWTGAAVGMQAVASAGPVLINGLPAGDYVFSVSGGTTTCRSIVEATIPHNDTTVMQVTATATDVSGCGASNGSITLNVSGGTAPFIYTVNGYITLTTSSRTPAFPNLPTGSYAVTVQDANGCSVAKTNILINTQGTTPIAGWSKTDAQCASSSGTLVYVPTPGIATDQYVVRLAGSNTVMGQTTGNVPLTLNVPGGTYLVTRTSSNSCVVADTLIVIQPTGLEINVQYGQPTCTSMTSGSIAVVQISGGTAPYTTTVTSASGVVANLTTLAAGSYTATVTDAHGCTISQVVSLTLGDCAACLDAYVYLQGALVNDIGVWPTNPVTNGAGEPLMRDDLRALGIIPLQDPYRMAPYNSTYTHVANPYSETIVNPAVALADRGENSVVDWVFLEFRSKANPSVVQYTRSALVLRNGKIVDVDGLSCLNISHMNADDYYVAVRHRNHLGVMTQTTRRLGLGAPTMTVDFRKLTPTEIWHDTDPNSAALYGNVERRDISWAPGYYVLWGGNADRNDRTVFQGQLTDVDEVFNQVITSPGNILNANSYVLNGYHSADVNMNGVTIFQGQNNETDIIFNIMIEHPRNILNSNSFNIIEQLP
ncbi:hypothetical protein ACFPMF_08625 [Larkinella bovis]|uniref:PKD domain-containing protein n=1 Tax=Larkinella bovis TaxID=683041 RepID=A0ABW0IAC4_9BACT